MNAPLPIGTAPIVPVLDSSGEGPALFLHVAIFLADKNNTVLSDSLFRVVSVQGQESVSEPFEFKLELHANDQWEQSDAIYTANNFSTQGGWTFDAVLGRSITFAISTPHAVPTTTTASNTASSSTAAAASTAGEPPTDVQTSSQVFAQAIASGSQPAPASGYNMSFFNGIVAGMAMGGPGIYHVTVRPSLWLLTLSNRYALHPQCSIQGAIASALSNYNSIEADYSALDNTATGQTQDWLQAGESDYQFVKRLMGKAHLLYYFRHTPTSHQLVFLNTPSYPDAVPYIGPLQYVHVDETPLGQQAWNTISNLNYEQDLAATTVKGSFVTQNEAWQGDAVMYNQPINTYSGSATDGTGGVAAVDLYKVYQYAYLQETADEFTQKTLSASNAASRRLSGTAYCSMFRAGYTFQIGAQTWAGGIQTMVRPDLDDRQFVLTKVEHQAHQDGEYSNNFEASMVEGLVCGFSLEETQQGSVLAVVVDGKANSHASGYDYQQASDFAPTTENCEAPDAASNQALSGVYVVLANAWPDGPQIFVKLGAYMQSVPSIGSLVLVGRANDETELPELQQVVHAVGNETVTPDGWTSNTAIGNAYSTHYGDGNSLSFGSKSIPNLKEATRIVNRAYNCTSVSPAPYFKDASYTQGASYNYSTSETSATESRQDLKATLNQSGLYAQANDLLSVSESFGSSFSRSSGEVQSNISTVGWSYADNTVKHTSVSVSLYKGDVTNTTIMKANNTSTTHVEGNETSVSTHRGNVSNTSTINGTNSSTSTVDGDETNNSTHNGNVSNVSVTNGNNENTTTVNGTDSTSVTYNGSTSNTTTVNGDSTSHNTTIGTQTNHMKAGVVNSMNMTGSSNSLNLSGSDSSMQVLGNSNSLRATLETNDIALLGAGITLSLSGAVLKTEAVLLSIELPVTLKLVM
ncbi:contractile injection system protein, VgrG/Pvc8 family [Hylemonella sp. W303a]|uniref:contractile injection system protein, VgrG/Pvc8 family n=1 Tax=Hylemonella sp. W303a TaxID=3389873 RepID=UPI00396B0410